MKIDYSEYIRIPLEKRRKIYEYLMYNNIKADWSKISTRAHIIEFKFDNECDAVAFKLIFDI